MPPPTAMNDASFSSLMQWLHAPVAALKGVGPAVSEKLARLHITTMWDLMAHVPAYITDRRSLPDLLEGTQKGERVRVEAEVLAHKASPYRSRAPYKVHTRIISSELMLDVVFFRGHADWLQKQLPVGEHVTLVGRVDFSSGTWQMPHPEVMVRKGESFPALEAAYHATEGLSTVQISKLVQAAIPQLPDLPEWQDAAWLAQQHWPHWADAVRMLHKPAEADMPDAWLAAKARLAYDECFAHQLALQLKRQQQSRKGQSLQGDGAFIAKWRELLPFALTNGQEAIWRDIESDMASPNRMLRLVQGDVGSGKTAVAALAMLRAKEAGKQAAMMAPTDLLCRQHIAWLQPFADALNIKLVMLTGKQDGAAQREALAFAQSGEADWLVGTHALFQDRVELPHLGVVVIDEQHRFGVEQRLKLAAKSAVPPDMLLMSATPIPRSLTLALYGDLDCSRLQEKPAGRQVIDTRVMPMKRLPDVMEAMARAVSAGQQCYWVCPLVEQSERLSLSDVESRYAQLREYFGDKVGMVHGRMGAGERDAVMQPFIAEKLQILLATTVIEVGVNVPNATIMVIEHAERFGLAQLHQLRGRVGRGEKQSSCLLLYGGDTSQTGLQRLKIMRDHDDGFVIAEEDCRLRGGGDVLGLRQSGLPQFKLADAEQQQALLPVAHDDARLLCQKDPLLQHGRGRAARLVLHLFQHGERAMLRESG